VLSMVRKAIPVPRIERVCAGHRLDAVSRLRLDDTAFRAAFVDSLAIGWIINFYWTVAQDRSTCNANKVTPILPPSVR